MTKLFEKIAYSKHRVTPGDTAFIAFSVASFVAAAALWLLPYRKVYSPSLLVLYSVLPPQLWAIVFLLCGIIPLIAVFHPTEFTRTSVYCILLPTGVAWTSGLFVAFFSKCSANFWAPLVWLLLTSLGYIAFALIPIDAPFYRRLRNDTLIRRLIRVFTLRYGRKGEEHVLVGNRRKGT